jgi:ABC-type sugar transport system ATPase subunit
LSAISFDNVAKLYPDAPAVSGFDLDVADGEFIVLVGRPGAARRRRRG